MARIRLNGSNKVDVELNKFVGYVFNPSDANILSVRVRDDYYKPDKLVDILNNVAGVIWQKDLAIDTYKKTSSRWERNYNKSWAKYNLLKRRLYMAGFVFLAIGTAALYVWGV